MTTYIIDFTRPDGWNDFQTVRADSIEEAIQIFRNRGTDGWTGYKFKDYRITAVSTR